MSQWFFMKGGQQYGPVSSSTLKQLAMNGELAPTDCIWREGLGTWVAASQANGLFASANTAPSALSPGQAEADALSGASTPPLGVEARLSAPQLKRHSSRRRSLAVLMAGALGVVAVAVCLVVLFTRDSWESDHREEVSRLCAEVLSRVEAGRYAEALRSHQDLKQLVAGHRLTGSSLSKVAEADQKMETARREVDRQNAIADALKGAGEIESRARTFVSTADFEQAAVTYQRLLDYVSNSRVPDAKLTDYIRRASKGKSDAEAAAKALVERRAQEAQRVATEERQRQEAAKAEAARIAAEKAARTDPAESFRRYSAAFVKAINSAEPVEATAVAGRARFSLIVGEYGMDVRKTDSLVSPFVGVLQFTAVLVRDGERRFNETFRLSFASQSEQWTLTKIEARNLVNEGWATAEKDLPVYAKRLFELVQERVPRE